MDKKSKFLHYGFRQLMTLNIGSHKETAIRRVVAPPGAANAEGSPGGHFGVGFFGRFMTSTFDTESIFGTHTAKRAAERKKRSKFFFITDFPCVGKTRNLRNFATHMAEFFLFRTT
uniref:Uncharacterized protein n=1 Tax=Cacopsylla melanoneura TaxID=428564 RepID=A0A8D8UTL3_9HEMI